jgi:hypothetical protein
MCFKITAAQWSNLYLQWRPAKMKDLFDPILVEDTKQRILQLRPENSTKCEFMSERSRLIAAIESFASEGPMGCSRYPHPFFGPLNPQQWAILAYKHVDHHLRQFGV